MLLLLAGLVLLQTPKVQSMVIHKVLSDISGDFDADISVGRINFLPFRTLIIHDLTIVDKNPYMSTAFPPQDTLGSVDYAAISFRGKNLIGEGAKCIDKAVVKGGFFNLTIEPGRINSLKRITHGQGPHPMPDKGDVLLIKKFDVKDFSFKMHNWKAENRDRDADCIDWMDFDINADVRGHGFHIHDACVEASVDDCSFTEKSGYSAWNVKGSAKVSSGLVDVSDFRLIDQWSALSLPYFTMRYDNYLSFRDFINQVRLGAKISDSRLDFQSLGHFFPIKGMDLAMDIRNAEVSGPVNDISVSGLDFTERSGAAGNLSVRLKDISNPQTARINGDIRHLAFTTSELDEIIRSFSPEFKAQLSNFAKDEHFNFSGSADGYLNDFNLDGNIISGIGSLSCNASVKNLLSKDSPIILDSRIGTENLDLGSILGAGFLHECTLGSRLSASLDHDNSTINIDSLGISKLNIMGYDYKGLAAAGTFSGNAFNGRIISQDPNLNFLFQGIFNLSKKTKNALYKFYFNLGYADLHALHLDSRETSRASLAVNANFMRISKGDIIGDMDVRDIRLTSSEGTQNLGNVQINSYSADNSHKINFSSSFAEGSYTGTKPFLSLVDAIKETALNRNLPALTNQSAKKWSSDSYKASFKFHDTRKLLSFAVPGFYIADGTDLNLDISRNGELSTSVKSQRIAFKSKYLKGLNLTVRDNGDRLRCNLTSDELSIDGIKCMDNNAGIEAGDNIVKLLYSFGQKDSPTSGALKMDCDFSRDQDDSLAIRMKLADSFVQKDGVDWKISPATIDYGRGSIRVDSLSVKSADGTLLAHGGWSKSTSDTLSLKMDRLDIGGLASLTGKSLGIEGLATGNAMILSPGTGIMANLSSSDASINGFDAGTIKIAATRKENKGDMSFALADEVGGSTTLNAVANYFKESSGWDGSVRMNGFELGYFSGLLKGVFSEMRGKASGEISIGGPSDRISLSSKDTRLDDGLLKVAYTNVPYNVSGPFHIDDTGIWFDDVQLRDGRNGNGTISGKIGFNHLKNFRMGLNIFANNVLAINTEDDGVSPIYGQVNASGEVTLTGPFQSLLLDINANTSGTGQFHIPLRSGSKAYGTDLLTFKEPYSEVWEDPYEVMMRSLEQENNEESKFGIKMNIGVRPETECSLEIDKESGSGLTGRGYGTIKLDLAKGKDFNIDGDYSLNEGNFHFAALGITNRNFGIQSGSSIKFNGDIMDSDLNINAKYSTKASIGTLISDTTSVSSRRTVECLLNIGDKLRNPRLNFSVDIPDLDPTTKSLVQSALSTEDKIQKQFLALLVTNSFLPDDQSGIVNNTEMLFSNVSEIMAGQLNNILQRLEIPLDLGLKYQPNEGGTDIFDVALSTQLFNNRVTMNGNIGNRQYDVSGSGQDVVGDLDIGIKLDKAGAVKLTLFSHSADQYTNYLDYSQRNGIGISYQKEFNTLKTFFSELFSSKKARQQHALENADKGRVTINIENE